jgi:hypothetical protein
MSLGAKVTPTPKDVSIEQLLYQILQFMDAGIGDDRVKKFLGSDFGASGASAADMDEAVPANCNLMKIQVGKANDVHIAVNNGVATAESMLYLAGGEYWYGPLTDAITKVSHIQEVGATNVYVEYFQQG